MSMTEFNSEVRPLVKTMIYAAADLFIRFLLCEKSPPRDFPIFVGETWPIGEERCIFYNCEQLTRQDRISTAVIKRAAAADVVEIWDYSQVNVDIWRQNGYTARLVPLQIPDDYIQKLREFRTSQPIEWDVGFCGSNNGMRRMLVLSALKKAGLKVRNVRARGEERDRQLAHCHVHINIHYSSIYKIWESHRCQAWLDVGVPIISENSLDNNPQCINVPFEKLVEETVRQVALVKKTEPNITSSHQRIP
jgi:hypothetical protein